MTEVQLQVRPGYRAVDNQVLIYDANLLDDVTPEYFELNYWQSNNAVLGDAPGRGTTYFVSSESGELALRHYKRGGAMGHIVSDHYLLSSWTVTRPWREWHLLMHLHNSGMPVCVPVAARVKKSGVLYKADLVTKRIMGARSWQEWMIDSELPGDKWVALGKQIRQFHNAGLYHHDLNIRNIMLSEDGKIYLIDFDKSGFRKDGVWQRGNLSRLLRSIHKVEKNGVSLNFSEASWGQLLQGYASAIQ